VRLVAKLTVVLIAGVAVVLTAQAGFHVTRVLELHERETRDDLAILGSALAAAVSEIWRIGGEQRARAYVEQADSRRARTRIQLLEGQEPGRRATAAAPAVLEEEGHLVAWAPLTTATGRRLHLRLARDLTDRTGFIRHVVLTQVVTTVAMVVVLAALAVLLGARLVGRRVERLAEQARRVAGGDFATTTEDPRRDELGFLAREMNQMANRLADAHGQIREERRARTEVLEQLRHSDRLSTIGRIASSIAHELGTPLNVVSGRAMMIAEDERVTGDAKENAGIIAQQAEQMTRNIRQLLDYARGQGVRRERTDLRPLVDKALRLMEPLAESQGVRLVHAGGRAVEASVDSGKTMQVLTNLIMNGIQAMPEGGTLEVRARAEEVDRPGDIHASAGPYVRIDVTDQGVGIAAQDLEQIFEPFFTTKRSGQGTGLGLSVCHGIVREHGGWLAVVSEPGSGSCFSVYLPREGAE
jgi:two-component system NtrC family sensor kinase